MYSIGILNNDRPQPLPGRPHDAQPQGKTINQGANWTAIASASGSAPLAWQWQWKGTNVAGATNSTLALTNIQTAQAGSYTLTVTNLAGSATSSNAVLSVVPLRIDSAASSNNAPLQLTITGAPGPGYAVEVSDDLTNWTILTSFTNISGVVEFTDEPSTNLSRRFYRAAAPR